jgi:hypothetical protein
MEEVKLRCVLHIAVERTMLWSGVDRQIPVGAKVFSERNSAWSFSGIDL